MQSIANKIIETTSTVILGKQTQIKVSLACLLAGGHLLIEDVPGMGKTTLAHTLAQALGLNFRRIQFTSDLLPADVIGVSVYDTQISSFTFHPGAVFTNVLLADEINRASPKTQSALLEAMEEQQVTVDGSTSQLPNPFFVIATQNPSHHLGTFSLPESQLDRFLMRIELGYPDSASERALLKNNNDHLKLAVPAVCDAEDVIKMQQVVLNTHLSDAILDYLQAIIEYTRQTYDTGMSPRAGIGLRKCAQAWAFLEGRDYVIPDDIQAIFTYVISHRIETEQNQNTSQHILQQVSIN